MSTKQLRVDVVIVGSGIMGAATAQLLREASTETTIAMVDGGSVIGTVAGQHLYDSPEAEVRDAYHRKVMSGIQSLYLGAATAPTVAEDVRNLVPGMYDAAAFGAQTSEMPAAAVAWNVGGMGAHWTAATPWPAGAEVVPDVDSDEWSRDLATAQRLLRVHPDPFALGETGRAVLRALEAEFGAFGSAERRPQPMPMAVDPSVPTGPMSRTGPNRIFPPLSQGDDAAFGLYAGALCTAVLIEDARVVGVRVRDVPSGTEWEIRAETVVVCADTLRTPQLLFASGIRPPALGRYLNEHAFITGDVVPDPERVGFERSQLPSPRESEWCIGSYWVPQNGPEQPFHVQMMERAITAPDGELDHTISLSWYVPTEVSAENRIEFSDTQTDATGMPRARIRYHRSDADLAMIERARESMRRAAQRLGDFDEATQAAVLAPGSSLHFTGTVRMGAIDDGTSVCDFDGAVWGLDGLYVAGNGVLPTAIVGNSTLTGVVTAVRAARAVAARVAAYRPVLAR